MEGYVYAACPPLYKVTTKNGKKESHTYLYTTEELDDFRKRYGESDNRTITRFKGLGEMQPEQLWETTMNPETRKLIQLKVDNEDEAEKTIELLMGNNVQARRDFLMQYL